MLHMTLIFFKQHNFVSFFHITPKPLQKYWTPFLLQEGLVLLPNYTCTFKFEMSILEK
jgi:hypothetical protein